MPTDNIPRPFSILRRQEADIILETGLKPSDRKMVHLSKTYADAVKAEQVRTEEPIILEIDTASLIASGVEVQRAARTVYLVREVPAEFLHRAEEEEMNEAES